MSHMSITNQFVDCSVITCIRVKYTIQCHIAEQQNKNSLASIRNSFLHILYIFLQIANETFLCQVLDLSYISCSVFIIPINHDIFLSKTLRLYQKSSSKYLSKTLSKSSIDNSKLEDHTFTECKQNHEIARHCLQYK